MSAADWVLLAAGGVAVFSVTRRPIRGKRSLLPTGVILWSAGTALQIGAIYRFLDPLVGGENVVSLLDRSLTITALACLDVMVLRATSGSKAAAQPRARAVFAVMVLAMAAQVALFASNSWSPSDASLSAWGGEWGREAYWSVMPMCVALFSVHVIVAISAEWRGHSVRATRWGLVLIGTGSVINLVWTAENLIGSIVRLGGQPSFLFSDRRDLVAQWLLLALVSVTATGVAVGGAQKSVDDLHSRYLLVRISPLWKQIVGRSSFSSPEASSSGQGLLNATDRRTVRLRGANGWPWQTPNADEVEAALCWKWIELLDREYVGEFAPDSRQRHLLEKIADSFEGGSRDRLQSGGVSSLLLNSEATS